ncbi:unnamed protein product, partial [Adineta steineri]
VASAKPQWNSSAATTHAHTTTTHKPATSNVKIPTQKLQWNAKSKIGSLDNAHYKPSGGSATKTDTKKADSKDKSATKTDNTTHETMTTGGSNEAHATVNDEHHSEVTEKSDEIMESRKNEDGNQ